MSRIWRYGLASRSGTSAGETEERNLNESGNHRGTAKTLHTQGPLVKVEGEMLEVVTGKLQQDGDNGQDDGKFGVELHMDSGSIIKVRLPEYEAANLLKGFHQHRKPIFACNIGEKDIFEVDLAKVEAAFCRGMYEGEGSLDFKEDDASSESRHRENEGKKEKKAVLVTCNNCGAEYETYVPAWFTRIRCRHCSQWVPIVED